MKKLRALKNKKGFTLVELIVVIVIIAILSAALVTSLVGYINKAKEANAQSEASNVLIAAQAYISERNGIEAYAPTKPDTDMIDAINEYLGKVVVGEGGGSITGLVTGPSGSITSFTYTATNGQVMIYDREGWSTP